MGEYLYKDFMYSKIPWYVRVLLWFVPCEVRTEGDCCIKVKVWRSNVYVTDFGKIV